LNVRIHYDLRIEGAKYLGTPKNNKLGDVLVHSRGQISKKSPFQLIDRKHFATFQFQPKAIILQIVSDENQLSYINILVK
jgi:hypothetical protein